MNRKFLANISQEVAVHRYDKSWDRIPEVSDLLLGNKFYLNVLENSCVEFFPESNAVCTAYVRFVVLWWISIFKWIFSFKMISHSWIDQIVCA